MKTFKDWDLTEGTWTVPYQIFFKSDAGKGNVEGTLKGKARNAKDAEKQADKALNKEADKVEKDKKLIKKHGEIGVDDAYLGDIVFKEHAAISRPVEDGGANVHDIADPATLKRVNAFVGSLADREYLNANHAISELRQKLMRIGVSFGAVEIYEGEGEVSVPLEQWGGRLGNDGSGTDEGNWVNDDGVAHRVDGGLSLNFKYMGLDNGSCKVFAKIA